MRCVVFELAGGGGAHMCRPPPPGRAQVAQTPGRARVNDLTSPYSTQGTIMESAEGAGQTCDWLNFFSRLSPNKKKYELAQLTLSATSLSSAHAQLNLVQLAPGSAHAPL